MMKAQQQQMAAMMPMGMNPAMLGMPGMNPGMNPFGQGMMSGMTPMAIQGPNGPMMVMMLNMMGQNPSQNPGAAQNQGGNLMGQMTGMGGLPAGFALPPGMANPFAMGMNPSNNNPNNSNSSDKNSNSTGMTPQNQLMMGMMPSMLNPLMLNQIMQ